MVNWRDELTGLLRELRAQEFDYPIGAQEIRSAQSKKRTLPAALTPLYEITDGVSLPDVHVGYFIDPAAPVSTAAKRGEPTRIARNPDVAVHVFGSDGGGGRFASDVADGAVYYLPFSGAVANGAFCEDSTVKARRLASSPREFLGLLNHAPATHTGRGRASARAALGTPRAGQPSIESAPTRPAHHSTSSARPCTSWTTRAASPWSRPKARIVRIRSVEREAARC